MVEHHAVALRVHLVDTDADVVQYALHLWTPRRQILDGLLERGDPGLAVVGDVRDAEGFEVGKATGVLGVAGDVARFERREALLQGGGGRGDRS